MHVCPMVTGVVPHVGGPIAWPGRPDRVDWRFARRHRRFSLHLCGAAGFHRERFATVLICSKPAARMGDTTAHGGNIVLGCPTVLIGG